MSDIRNGDGWFCCADDLNDIVKGDKRVLVQIHCFVKVGTHAGFDIGGVCAVFHQVQGVGEARTMEFGLIHDGKGQMIFEKILCP